jgi:hypothetical protein
MQINQYPQITSVSDGDLFVVQTASDDALKCIAASDLQAYFGSASTTGGTGTTGTSPSLPKARNFVSNGDANGTFYYLGTNLGVSAWSNPSGNQLTVTASSVAYGNVGQLTDRSSSDFWTSPSGGSWIEFNLGTYGLTCNYYSIKSRALNTDYYPRNWKLQGSNDGNTWTTLDTQSNNVSLNAVDQWLSLPVLSSVSYSYFKLLQTGVDSSGADYFCLGEIELYGYLIDQPVSTPVNIGTIST